MGRWLWQVVRAVGVAALVATLVVPVAALLVRALRCDAGTLLSVFSERYWMLLAKTVGLASGAAVLAMVLGLPAAFVVGGRRSTLVTGLVVLPLMMPAMVMVFGWQRFWGPYTPGLEGWAPWLRAMWCWACWYWPVVALMVGAGWARGGRAAYEAAVLETTGWVAFRRAALPGVARHAGMAALVLMAVMVGEYTVPHANGVIVLSAELMAIAEGEPFDAAGGKIAVGCVVPLVMVAAIGWVVTRLWGRDTTRRDDVGALQVGRWRATIVVAIVAVTVGVPTGLLMLNRDVPSWFRELIVTYGSELAGTFGVAAATAVVVMCIGVAAVSVRGTLAILLATLAMGVLPGALIGESMLAAYQRIDVVYNHWPILVLGLVGRYAWVGCLLCWLAMRATARDQVESVRLEGATSRGEVVRSLLVHQWPTLAGGAFLVLAFALADVDVVAIVAVPSPRMMATILVEKFHRFETGMMVSIGLTMVLAIVPAVALLSMAMRYGRRRA